MPTLTFAPSKRSLRVRRRVHGGAQTWSAARCPRGGGVSRSYALNGMTEEAQSTMDEKKRLALYQRINKLWIEEVPAVPLYQQIDLYGASKRLVWKARTDELMRVYDMALRAGQ
jgi:ABC-type transport system substrate-binding protein